MSPAEFFAAYDAFGERRTGGDADLASASWLRDAAAAAGARASTVEVAFERFLPGPSFVEVDGTRIDGLPLFDGGTTGPAGADGPLGALGADAPIGFARMSPRDASLPGNAFARARATSRHAAIVVAMRSRGGGLAPLNAHDAEHPFGPAVLQVPDRDGERLEALAARGAPARVVVTGTRGPSRSANVRASLDAAGADAAPLVLLTPRTSWWTSTAERAGGILAWLEAIRGLAAPSTARRRPVVALATCGHEIGHVGAHRAFTAEPALARDAVLVIHLGANLGAAQDPRTTVRSNVPGLAQRMVDALAAAGHPVAPLEAVGGGTPTGEAHEIASRGGRYLSLVGANPWFHAPDDRWPHSVDPDRATAIARGVAALATDVAGG